ncbi:MAG: hypothetical protein HY059_14335 [Proteobacteria bacterium]|nr:hypothetical protein [Pseudomonadota bacterium]
MDAVPAPGPTGSNAAKPEAGDHLLDEAPEAAPARRFEFANKVFKVENGVFHLDESTDEPVYTVDLGDVRASLTFATLRASFGVEPESPDGLLLADVKRALAFVRQVRAGDTFPSELLDGTASWKVDARHREVARGRVWVGLVTWMSGGHADETIRVDEFAKIASSPEARARVQAGFGQLADTLGYPADRRGDVVEQLERLIDELAFVEALRERVALARRVVGMLRAFKVAFKRERTLTEELDRTILLAERPVAGLEKRLAAVDARSGDAPEALRHMAAHVKLVRETRDALHAQMMKWDAILTAWDGVTTVPDAETHRLIRNTYRFVARHFPVETAWKR